MCTGVEGYGVVVWVGKYTDIAFLVLLFGFTQPICRVQCSAGGGGGSQPQKLRSTYIRAKEAKRQSELD